MTLEISPTSNISPFFRWGSLLFLLNALVALVVSPRLIGLVILYSTLLIHTAAAAPFFAPLVTTKNASLRVLSVSLAVIYGLLAWSLYEPIQFFVLLMMLFIFAAIGYRILYRITGRNKFKQKIFIDGGGALMALGTLLGTTAGYATQLIPIVTTLYILVTVWMLWMRPYYTQ